MDKSVVDHEVIIIGSGPAGAAAAVELARRGRRVLLVERQRFPRFHVGESLLPASNELFRRLGVDGDLRCEGFVVKRGASFTTDDGELSSHIDFSARADVSGPLTTYQVLRSRFDEILLARALAAGVEVRQECRAQDVTFASDRVRVALVDAAGASCVATAAVVVDASGQSGFLAKRLGLRRVDPRLRNVAFYAHYENVARPEGERAGDLRIVSRRDMSWIWFIPLSDTLTSVGLVLPRAEHAALPSESREATLDRYVAATPVAAVALREARRASPTRVEADFSYGSRAYAGDRWLLAGDAGSFLDPVFSTGVQVALESGVEAAQAIERALAAGDVSARAFAAFDRIQRRRYRFFRRFAHGFYQPAFRDLFFHPTQRLGLLDALISALAGHWRPPFSVRWRIELFFAVVAAQRFLPLAPRRHGLAASGTMAVEEAP